MLWPQNQHRSRARRPAGAAAILLLAGAAAYGQTNGGPSGIPGGQGEIAFQGYYLGGNQQDLLNTTGTAFHFQEFLPALGFLSGSLEGYGAQNRFQTGDNFLELRGTPWMGLYWTFTGGDFRLSANLVQFPFNNIFNPEIHGRGVKVQAVHGDTQYAFFYGEETLTAGPRVAYFIMTPQTVMGVSAVRKVAPHWLVGARFMQFSASPQSIAANPDLFPAGRTTPLVRTMAMQSLYTPVKRLKIYAEVSRPMAAAARTVTSFLAGATWEDTVFTLKANYAYQGTLYFPLAGYYAGDRQGPFAEARLHPWKRLELYGSASQYRNNLEHDSSLPLLNSTSTALGMSALLPGKLSATGQVSTVAYSDQAPGEGTVASNNRQISGALSRTIGRQTLQVNWRDIRMDMQPSSQRQRSSEAGDSLQFRHFTVGGTVRYQQVTGSERLNSLFFRGLAQANLGPFSAFANVEVGNDLANQTVFSTEAYRTSVVGVSVRLKHGWNLQAEMFRNQLNFALNPENIFLLENGALEGASPAAESLAAIGQWSFYFRLSKQIRWGGGLPTENADQFIAKAAPLVGSIAGVVRLKTLAAASYVPGIPVSLDGGQTATTGPDGRYVFENIPEGPHEVALSLAQLPADFDPGDAQKSQVVVQPRRTSRTDFEVLPLVTIQGTVHGPDQAPLEDIVIRLGPGSRYTTTNKEGGFTFYNVREGDFELALDPKTLPEGGALSSPASIPVAVRVGAPPPALEFTFVVNTTQKPIRKVLDRK
ncbi:MAG: carboxypeptidase-like regulatory domain-containing protein [Bryobacteraceae bacterium]